MSENITRDIVEHLRHIIGIPQNTKQLVLTLDSGSPPTVMIQMLVVETKEPVETTVTSRYELKLIDKSEVV